MISFPPLYQLIVLSSVALFFSWGSWGIVYNNTSPFLSPQLAIPLFYASGGLSLMLSIFLTSLLLRLAFFQESILAKHVSSALRQGLLWGSTLLLLLLFQQFRVLNSSLIIMLISFTLLLELFFSRR